MNQWEDFSFVDVHSYRVKLQAYRDQLEEFCTQLDKTRHRVCETVRLYEFFDKVRQGICCTEEGVKSLLGLSPVLDCLWKVWNVVFAPSESWIYNLQQSPHAHVSAVIFFKSECEKRGGCVFQNMSTSVKHRSFLLSELELFNPFHGHSEQHYGSAGSDDKGQKMGWLSWPPCQGRPPAFSCCILTHWTIQPVDPSRVAPCSSVLNTVQLLLCWGLPEERGTRMEGREVWLNKGSLDHHRDLGSRRRGCVWWLCWVPDLLTCLI